eukprot:3008895-Rhodomonas_salina.5
MLFQVGQTAGMMHGPAGFATARNRKRKPKRKRKQIKSKTQRHAASPSGHRASRENLWAQP